MIAARLSLFRLIFLPPRSPDPTADSRTRSLSQCSRDAKTTSRTAAGWRTCRGGSGSITGGGTCGASPRADLPDLTSAPRHRSSRRRRKPVGAIPNGKKLREARAKAKARRKLGRVGQNATTRNPFLHCHGGGQYLCPSPRWVGLVVRFSRREGTRGNGGLRPRSAAVRCSG